MQARDFFIQLFRQYVYFVFIALCICVEFNLCHHLVCKRGGHYKAWVAGGATQIHQAALCQYDNAFSIRKNNMIYLGFNFLPGV